MIIRGWRGLTNVQHVLIRVFHKISASQINSHTISISKNHTIINNKPTKPNLSRVSYLLNTLDYIRYKRSREQLFCHFVKRNKVILSLRGLSPDSP